MIKKLSLTTILIIVTPLPLMAAVDTSMRGYLSAKGNYYLKDAEEDFGTRARAQLEQETKFNSNFELVNQVRFTYSSLYTDISKNPSDDSKDTKEFYPGDNYLKYKSEAWVLQTGYQDIAWGEAFGFNYADIVNPKDLRETFYASYADSKLPLFLVNFKYFFESGSMQLIYSPEPRFSRNLPVDLFIKGILPQTNIKTVREDSPVFFKEHEIGGKLAASFWGLDASLFHFSYLDRDPTYSLRSMTQTSIELEEAHTRVKTTGLSVAALFYDDFVFRTDIVYTKDKAINSVQGFNLVNSPIDMTNIVMSLDTPTYNNFSGVFVMANSRLSKDLPQAFRQQSQSYSVAKIAYDLGLEKTIDLSYSREWNKKGHALQSLFFWPLNASTEIRVGAETYWGEESGQFNKIRNISSVFVGIKNYFQL